MKDTSGPGLRLPGLAEDRTQILDAGSEAGPALPDTGKPARQGNATDHLRMWLARSRTAFSALTPDPDGHLPRGAAGLGVAVSGGGDSVALLRLLAELGVPGLRVYTVDHGLRPEARDEALWTGRLAASLGLAHRILDWRWDGAGNLAEAASRGRYAALAEACAGDGLADCALAHTRDDNVETLFLGLLRGAGLDGLAGMRPGFVLGGIRFHRPLLAVSRHELRQEMTRRGQDWHEDPTNADLRHDRARIRHLLAGLDLPAERLGQSLAAMAATRRDLGTELLRQLAGAVSTAGPDLRLDWPVLAAMTPEFRRRSLSAALKVVGRAPHPPRAEKLGRLVAREWRQAPGPVTLHGCRIRLAHGALLIGREFAALPPPAAASGTWEGWTAGPVSHAGLHGLATSTAPSEDVAAEPAPAGTGLHLGALGAAGLAQLDNSWREARIPRASMLASPGLWQGARLVAAAFGTLKDPQPAPNWQFHGPDLPTAFTAALMAH